jgi:tetratricopeptide (TPR) repeat protein
MKTTRVSAIALTFSLLVIMPVNAWAQHGGLRGKVVDQSDAPVEGVEIFIEFLGGVTREARTSSNENGDFIQVGMRSGNYRLSFRKDGYEPATEEFRVRLGAPTDVGTVVIEKLAEGALSREEVKQQTEEIKNYFQEGVAAVEKEDYAAALISFQKALEVAPEFPQAHFNMGYVYEKMDEPDKAIPCYEKACELKPDYYDAWVELGNIHSNRGDHAKAVEALGKAVEINDTEIAVLFNYGASAMNAGDIPIAENAFGKVLAIDPNYANASFQMGMVMVNQAKNEEAITYLEKYLELDPEGPNAATAKGMLDYLKK